MKSTLNHNRYQRQIALKEFGLEGQEKLTKAKIFVVGAGGLGCPCLQYLAAAGVGTIGIIDFDVVEESNLHRQILFGINDIGKPKAETAALKLKQSNPEIQIQFYNEILSNQNALQLFSEYDVIIDGSDNFATRYMVNDACVILNKPLVYGAVFSFEGQVGVFNFSNSSSEIKMNYRDLFPNPLEAVDALSCNEAGVLGVIPGIIGTMQAAEAIKIMTGVGKVMANAILSYNMLQNTFYNFTLTEQPKSKIHYPANKEEFLIFDYDLACGSINSDEGITTEEFRKFIAQNDVTIIDVREMGESPEVNEFAHLKIPMSDFENGISNLDSVETIIVFCQSGQRSKKAIEIMRKRFPNNKVLYLKNGITAFKPQQI